jgi:hypothetical protein
LLWLRGKLWPAARIPAGGAGGESSLGELIAMKKVVAFGDGAVCEPQAADAGP